MAIGLEVLALYALSSKMKGDRVREQQKQQKEAANVSRYIIKNPETGAPTQVTGEQIATMDNPTILSYKFPGMEKFQEHTPEVKTTYDPVYFSEGTGYFTQSDWKSGKFDDYSVPNMFTGQPSNTGSFSEFQARVGAFTPIGEVKMENGVRVGDITKYPTTETEPYTQTSMQYGTTVGTKVITASTLEGLAQQAVDLNVEDLTELTVTQQQITVDQDNRESLGEQKVLDNAFGSPEEDPEEITYTRLMVSPEKPPEGSVGGFININDYDPKTHGPIILWRRDTYSSKNVNQVIEEGEIKKFSTGAGTDTDALSEAINVADNPLYLKVPDGNNVLVSKELDASEKIMSLSSQLASNTAAVDYINNNPNAKDVNNFTSAIYNAILADYNRYEEDSVSGAFQPNRTAMSLSQFTSEKYPIFYNDIPAIKEAIDTKERGDDVNFRKELENKQNNASDGDDSVAIAVTGLEPNPMQLVNPNARPTVMNRTVVKVPVSYVNFANSTLLPIFRELSPYTQFVDGKSVSPKDQSVVSLNGFIDYEIDPVTGDFVLNEVGNKVLSVAQPRLHTLKKWNDTSYRGLEDVTYFNIFREMIDPRSQSLFGVVRGEPEYMQISRNFYDMHEGNIRKATDTVINVAPFSPGSEQSLYQKLGVNSKQLQDRQNNFRDVKDSSRRGINLVDKLVGTFYDERGNLTESTFVGKGYLAFEGAEYLINTVSNLAGLNIENSTELKNWASGNDQKLLATGKGYTITAEGQEMIRQEMEALAESEFAEREFMYVVLAYEIAAAIQGGTGGRTISDQDVAMIMRGLRTNALSTPQSQLAVLDSVKSMLQEFEYKSSIMSGGNKPKHYRAMEAYMIAEDLFVSAGYSGPAPLTVDDVVSRFSAEAPQNQKTDATLQQILDNTNQSIDDFNKELLIHINENQTAINEPPFASLDEAKEDPNIDFGGQQTDFTTIFINNNGNMED